MESNKLIITEFSRLAFTAMDTLCNNVDNLINDWSVYYNSLKGPQEQQNVVLLNEISSLLDAPNYFDVLDINKFKEWYDESQEDQLRNQKDGHNFNIFSLLKKDFGFSIQETMHSKLLKFLLDASESHGLGNLFLYEFLDSIGIESPEKGTWYVTAEQDRIDILLQRSNPQSVVIIENKSNQAIDQQNQLYRYWYRAIYLKTKRVDKEFYNRYKSYYQIIYLAPHSGKQYEEQSITKPREDPSETYKTFPEKIPMEIVTKYFNTEIQSWLTKCKSKMPATNHRIKEYISQYQMLCNTL